jgi:error-prone DNA polymerase
MKHLRERLSARRVVGAQSLQHIAHKSVVTVAGLVLARQRPATASGIVFVTLEDETGTINLVVFKQVFEEYRSIARHSRLMLAHGVLERQLTQPRPGEVGRATAVIHVIAQQLERLDGAGYELRAPSRDFH